MPSDELALGRLGAPHGLKGHVRFVSYSGETAHILKLKDVTLRGDDRKPGSLAARVVSVVNAGKGVAIRFEGYESPEAARALVGFELYAPRAQACPLRRDEFYATDLAGSSLLFDGRPAAVVAAVVDGGGGQLLACRLPDGRERFVPFRKEFIGRVDTDDGTMELLVDWILDREDSAETSGEPGAEMDEA
ncbi:MAG: ribosome maturation factor RimM [Spirochaetes bacterium]|nr:ribosome maturation factor RimM [Spirochaetota bacterium]